MKSPNTCTDTDVISASTLLCGCSPLAAAQQCKVRSRAGQVPLRDLVYRPKIATRQTEDVTVPIGNDCQTQLSIAPARYAAPKLRRSQRLARAPAPGLLQVPTARARSRACHCWAAHSSAALCPPPGRQRALLSVLLACRPAALQPTGATRRRALTTPTHRPPICHTLGSGRILAAGGSLLRAIWLGWDVPGPGHCRPCDQHAGPALRLSWAGKHA